FERLLRLFVIGVGKFPGAIFEAKVAKIVVNNIATFHQLIEFRAMSGDIRRLKADVENEENHRRCEQDAGHNNVDATHRLLPIRDAPAPEELRRSADHLREPWLIARANG